jgi:glutathione S-transferase
MTQKGLDFDEVLINLQGGKPSWYSSVVPTGNTPAILDTDGQVVHDSLRILRYLEERYPESPLLPADPAAQALADELIAAFARAMPQGARPSSRGAFLYRGSGLPLPQATFEATLSAVEDLLARAGGPLFLGADPSIVDCAWAPFLERWRVQAPLLHPPLARLFPDPAGGTGALPRLAAWYAAMDARVPAYLARIKGDPHTWRLALAGAGGGAVAAPHDGRPPADADWLRAAAPPNRPDGVWATHAARAAGRAPPAATARAEAAARLVGNRRAVLDDACAALGLAPGPGPDRAAVDAVLRAAAALLASDGPAAAGDADRRAVELLAAAGLLGGGGADADGRRRLAAAAAVHVGDRVCVPRDMGLLPAAELRDALASLHRAASAP